MLALVSGNSSQLTSNTSYLGRLLHSFCRLNKKKQETFTRELIRRKWANWKQLFNKLPEGCEITEFLRKGHVWWQWRSWLRDNSTEDVKLRSATLVRRGASGQLHQRYSQAPDISSNIITTLVGIRIYPLGLKKFNKSWVSQENEIGSGSGSESGLTAR